LDYELTDDEKLDDEETMDDEEDDEVIKELSDDVNVNFRNDDTEMTDANQGASKQQNISQESEVEQEEEDAHLLNLENPSPANNEITSLLETSAHHATTIPEITFGFTTTTPPPTPFFNPILQHQTPSFTTITSINPTVTSPKIPNFASVFKFDQRVSTLESKMSEFKQTNQFVEVVSSITGTVDMYLASKMKEVVDVAVQLQTNKVRKEAQAENQEFLNQVDSTMKTIIKDQVIAQVSKIMPKIKKYVTESLGAEVLVRSTNQPQTAYAVAASLGRDDQDKDEDPSAGSNQGTKRRKSGKDTKSSKDISQAALAEEPPISFDEFNDTTFDFFAFVMNRLKIPNLSQEILVGPAFNLLKGTCKSITELEYHLEECSKATTKRLDWHNPENKPNPFDLRKPLLLIQDHRGRQIIPHDYFINNDLEYLKGGDLSRRYSTSVTKTKDATYDLKWIEDLVPKLWSPVTVKYDKHAYWGTSYWGPKRQRFYGFTANISSSMDVYSRKRIIAVTRLLIMKKYDYGHLEEIEVHRDDQKLYKFREGDFSRLRLQDIEDMLLLLVQKKLTNLTIDQCDGTLDDVRSALNDIAKGIRMEYLPKRKWSDLDKQRARVMIQDIDKKLFERRLMRNLEKFVSGREYGNDLRLLERTI
ncbi:hypothetical protein Tco_0716947, partial [Tanacetum coccineum]